MNSHVSSSFGALTLHLLKPEYSSELDEYNGCWWPGSWCRQVISSHDIGYVVNKNPCLLWWRVSTTCTISMLRNNRQCKYVFMFPQTNSARQRLSKNEWLIKASCLSSHNHSSGSWIKTYHRSIIHQKSKWARDKNLWHIATPYTGPHSQSQYTEGWKGWHFLSNNN